MNVLLVTVDSLRADRVTGKVMPETRSFADDVTEFADCVANGSSTPASFPAILASRHFASIEGLGLPEHGDAVTLAEHLRGAGYATAGFTDNHFASGSYHFDRGFDVMHDASGSMEAGSLKQLVQSNLDKDSRLFRSIEWAYTTADGLLSSATGHPSEYERAASLNERALDWIDGCESDDWFVWLHYMDPHHPYEPPPTYQEQYLDETVGITRCRKLSRKATHHPDEVSDAEWQTLEALYDAECRYVDDQFVDLLDELDRRGMREETLTVFTADHGELFGEHDRGGHPGEFWEGVIRVPLLVDVAGHDGRVDGQVRLIDVAPTITDAVGIEPPNDWSGQTLLPVADRDEAIELAFGDVGRDIDYEKGYVRRADGWKLLDHHEDGEHLFDVSRTPAELPADERRDAQPDILEDLRAQLQTHRDEMARSRRGARGVDQNEEMVEQHLKDLGYR